MITQINALEIRASDCKRFELAFDLAVQHLQAAQGYLGHSLSRSLDRDDLYLLVIQWQRLEDHTEGFRNAPGHLQWKALLDPFYTVKPLSMHFAAAFTGNLQVSSAKEIQ